MAGPSDDDFVEDVGEMIEYTTEFMMSLGREATPDGQALAAAVKSMIREKYQGERVSIKTKYLGCPHADKIRSEYNGTNLEVIMKRYGVSRATVYRCLKD